MNGNNSNDNHNNITNSQQQQQSPPPPYHQQKYNEENWCTKQCRESVANKIHDAIQFSNVREKYSGTDMENHAFQMAKNYDEYVRLVAKIITHLRDTRI